LVREDRPNILLLGSGGSLGPTLGLEPAELSRDCGIVVDDRHPGFATCGSFLDVPK
jgi:hypothetical protein